jgi:uncharacterized membrane protein
MVEVKYNRRTFWRIIIITNVLCWFLFAFSLFVTIANKQYNMPEAQLYLAFSLFYCLLTLFLSKILYNVGETFSIIFNDDGIIQNIKVNIGFIVFFNKKFVHPWEEIVKFDYNFGFSFFRKHKNPINTLLQIPRISLFFLMVNIEEALEFALTKIPPTCKITKKARIMLERKYGITLDEVSNG